MKITQYILRRLLTGALLLLGVSILSFSLSCLVPGTYLDELRLNPQVSPETIAQLRTQYGIGDPVGVRYLHWMASVAHGNFGFSLAYNMPVSDLLRERCSNTILLAGIAMLIVWIVALPLGMVAATRGGWLDRVLTMSSSLLLSIPELAVILVLLVLAIRLGILPFGGVTTVSPTSSGWARGQDFAAHLLVPVLALSILGLPIVFHHVRSAVKQVLDAPFIKAAVGHGIGKSRLLVRHALPAAANPLVSLLGLSIAGLIGSSLLTEVITGWPGLGPLFVQSIFARDFYVVIAIVLLSSSLLVIGNFFGDVLLCIADPRIRTQRRA